MKEVLSLGPQIVGSALLRGLALREPLPCALGVNYLVIYIVIVYRLMFII